MAGQDENSDDKKKANPKMILKGCLIWIILVAIIVACVAIFSSDSDDEVTNEPEEKVLEYVAPDEPNPLSINNQTLKELENREWSDSISNEFGGDFRSTEVGSPSIEIMVSDSSNICFVKSRSSNLILTGTVGYDPSYNWYKKRQEKLEAQFSQWDGSHIGATRYLKKNLNDPDSYEHVETRYVDHGGFMVLTIKYRASNAFGAKILSTNTAMVTLDGGVLAFE